MAVVEKKTEIKAEGVEAKRPAAKKPAAPKVELKK